METRTTTVNFYPRTEKTGTTVKVEGVVTKKVINTGAWNIVINDL